MQRELGDTSTDALIGLHCFTECDSVSSLYGKGKHKAFNLLQTCQKECTWSWALKMLGNSFDITEEMVSALEVFVCQLHDGKKDYTSVNEVRYNLFKTATKAENVMPPNRYSLRKHILRANYQASIYKQSFTQFHHATITSG